MNNNYNDEEMDALLEEVLFEECFAEDVESLDEETRKSYLESEEAAILEARKLINGKTRIRMSKLDDLSRRTTLGAMHIAKAKNDPLFAKFTVYRAKEKLMKKKIVQKYGSRAQRGARISQKQYLKRTPLLQKLRKNK